MTYVTGTCYKTGTMGSVIYGCKNHFKQNDEERVSDWEKGIIIGIAVILLCITAVIIRYFWYRSRQRIDSCFDSMEHLNFARKVSAARMHTQLLYKNKNKNAKLSINSVV